MSSSKLVAAHREKQNRENLNVFAKFQGLAGPCETKKL
jgi:hypothetical protein